MYTLPKQISLKNIWSIQIKCVSLQQQIPPRLSTMRTTVGLRFLYGYMNYDKQPINIDEQLTLLQNRGLLIEDIATAKLQLRNISYFRIASYFRYMEEDSQHHLYKSGSTFGQAINLYLFDKELRQLIFKAIQDIEISLRTKMIQVFSMEHGAFWFMDSSLFKNADFYDGCLDNIKKEVSRSNEDFIKEHYEKYTFPTLPPVWKTLEVVSFGTLSKVFCLFKDNRLKKQVAREFGLPQYTYLESWIRCITVLRNCCAHHARIWNRRFALKPQLPNRLPLHWITPCQKPIKLYHQLCTLLYLEQTITPCMDLKSSLLKLFAENPNVDLHAMGFPQGWENEPLWRY